MDTGDFGGDGGFVHDEPVDPQFYAVVEVFVPQPVPQRATLRGNSVLGESFGARRAAGIEIEELFGVQFVANAKLRVAKRGPVVVAVQKTDKVRVVG